MARYAAETSVPTESSRAEIERTIRRYGASHFAYGWESDRAAISFRLNDRQVRFILPLPDREQFRYTEARQLERSEAQIDKEHEQASRQAWRALNLVIKAKLEAVESGITEFEDEFLAHIVLPDGSTVGDRIRPAVDKAYETGQMPSFNLLALGTGS